MLTWFVRLDPPEVIVNTFPWGVWKGGFRDSVHENKYFAEQRRDELLEEEGYE